MFKHMISVVALLCGLILNTSWAAEETVPLDKVPKAVLDAVKAKFAGAETVGAAKEDDQGKTVYEVTLKDKGLNIDVGVTPEGRIVIVEKEIAVKELPAAVTKGIESKHPKATIKFAEHVTKIDEQKKEDVYYEALVDTADKKTLELEVNVDGTIRATEDKTNAKDDEQNGKAEK